MKALARRAFALAVVAALAAGCSSGARLATGEISTRVAAPSGTVHPNRSVVAYGGQFLASCAFSHSAQDDPIMHRGHPGSSHLHEFFGNTTTDATSTYASLADEPSTCSDAGDRSAYWVPALYLDGRRIEPKRVDAYYRVGEGVAPDTVRPFPDGLETLAGDQHATATQPFNVAAWACGGSPEIVGAPPKDCTPDRPVQLRLTYPSCWDGEHVASPDHTSHMAYPSSKQGCPTSHPVAVPQLTLTVHYPYSGNYTTGRLASGDFVTTHGDFLAGWQHKRIADQVTGCLQRSVTCGLVGGTFHTGEGAGDENTYNRRPASTGRDGWSQSSTRE